MQALYENYIGGEFVESAGAAIEVTNPANLEFLTRIPNSTASTVTAAIQSPVHARYRAGYREPRRCPDTKVRGVRPGSLC